MPEVTKERFFQAAAEHQEQWATTKLIRPDWHPEEAGVFPMKLIGISFSQTKKGDWAIYPQLQCLAPGYVNKVDGGWYLQLYAADLPSGQVETTYRRRCMGHVASFLSVATLDPNPQVVLQQLEELAEKKTVFNISYEKSLGALDPETGKNIVYWNRSVKGVDLSARGEDELRDPNEAPWDEDDEKPDKNTG